jgi:hypothetical protein
MRQPFPRGPRAEPDLIRQLEAELAALADLDRQREDSLVRIEGLRAQLPPAAGTPTGPVSAAAKVSLFRSLFRGRQDLFPARFVSRKTGKAGYAPACTNKFVPGVCELPRVKCGVCQHQAFVPVTDKAILDHLQGRHIIGLYPMLPDETCCLLAVDFDDAAWRDVGTSNKDRIVFLAHADRGDDRIRTISARKATKTEAHDYQASRKPSR